MIAELSELPYWSVQCIVVDIVSPEEYEPLAILIDYSKLPLPSTAIGWLEEDIVEYACEP